MMNHGKFFEINEFLKSSYEALTLETLDLSLTENYVCMFCVQFIVSINTFKIELVENQKSLKAKLQEAQQVINSKPSFGHVETVDEGMPTSHDHSQKTDKIFLINLGEESEGYPEGMLVGHVVDQNGDKNVLIGHEHITNVRGGVVDIKFDADEDHLNEQLPELDNQMKKAASIDDDSWTCQICNLAFESAKGLIRHHKLIGWEAFKCDTCQNVFHSSHKLQTHIQRFHPNKNPTPVIKKISISKVKCPHCKKEYASRQTMYHHLNSKHLNIKYFCKAQYCNMFYTSLKSARTHVNGQHSALLEGSHVDNYIERRALVVPHQI